MSNLKKKYGCYVFVVGIQLQSPRFDRCYHQQQRTDRVIWLSKYIYTAGCTFIATVTVEVGQRKANGWCCVLPALARLHLHPCAIRSE